MLRTINTSLLAFLIAIAICILMVLYLPVGLHNRLLLTVVFVVPIWLAIALWVTQKNNMKRVLVTQIASLVVLSLLITLGLLYG
ncbi:hypothetical protein [Kangiella koreensis]|uniref:Uncharacterized protein n=1 Tax=Kangiella koreensis (strain DSM 16069 / JCM 12317 / KCTC 12182 / SW-125) TaxID=523791 RepID=C7R6Z9_KANKD|nr:hypothetical protein [Kangiella koreensis]ACV27455.1 hypothetical protein Kkor_2045 [Kangiella koreensis DSM 16069]